jgi:hypothetical protein
MEICSVQDDGELKKLNNAQHDGLSPLPHNWHHFRSTLVFAGHSTYISIKYELNVTMKRGKEIT